MSGSIYFDIKNTDQFDLFTKSSHICVVDFHAHWCGPCKILSPKLENIIRNDEDLANEVLMNLPNIQLTNKDANKKITFVKINVDNFGDLAQIFKVSSIPHLAFFKNGNLQEKVIIGPKCDEIVAYIKKLHAN